MPRNRKQSGYIYRRSGFWALRYRQTINQGGELKTIQKARQLCPVDATHKTKKSVQELAEDALAPVNGHKRPPETIITMGDFVTDIYLPFVTAQKRPSTYKGYRDMWEDHLKPRCEKVLLRDVRTCYVQRWLEAVAAEDRTKTDAKLSRESLKHIKSLLSGIFAHAKRQGFFDGVNPVADTAIPPAPNGGDSYAYSLEEITRMLLVLPEPAATLVATAGFTGARRGEIRGMRWEKYHDGAIYIDRSVWESHITEPKTKASKAPIPIIPTLVAMLQRHRERLGNPMSGVMFPASNGKPVSLNNVLNRQIKPALRQAGIEWHGWHAFRRGLATNLYRLGVPEKTIQAILRHSNLSTTQNIYIKSVDADSVTAMKTLEALMCANRAPQQPTARPAVVN